MTENTRLVSVVMITYNHEKYIKKAIESVLMQETDFDFELIISNDCSSDGTHKVIEKIINNHPKSDKINYTNHPENIGMMPNFQYALENASGKYVAICDGDDYWTDSKKLQKQADFLENNPDYAICHHNVIELRGLKKRKRNHKLKENRTTDLAYLAKGNYIHSSTIFLRNKIDKFPDYFKSASNGDYFILMLMARYGKIKYFMDIMSIYRIHKKANWSSQKKRIQRENHIHFLENIKENFDTNIQLILDKQIDSIKQKNIDLEKNLLGKIKSIFNR